MGSLEMAGKDVEFVEEDDAELEPSQVTKFSQAVLHATDWTVETIISQLERGNIDLNPRFQRRDAWSLKGKSRFIESIVLGLPIPQIVLAEKKRQRGTFIVLDGKQRLLSLMQYAGKARPEDANNKFGLTGLDARTDLRGKTLPELPSRDTTTFLNQTIRTVAIRNWPNNDFLHLVFLRLNTGTVRLSPQELRQAMAPGKYSDFIDEWTFKSTAIQQLLSRDSPDPRMRDVELLARHLALKHFLPEYAGRMKPFLDAAAETFNDEWNERASVIQEDAKSFDEAIFVLLDIFATTGVARKNDSYSFNRAIFDALSFYAVKSNVMKKNAHQQSKDC